MFSYHCLNPIAKIGTDIFKDKYENTIDVNNADAILVRSADMLDMPLSNKLQAIARAGAGTNNIPLEKCADAGIVVFNTPGANANGVKELVIAGLLLGSRDIIGGVNWVYSEKNNLELAKISEKKKKDFAGKEIFGKKLGVIGLGAIGVLVANAASSLGMDVYGYDPYISVDAAWNLSKGITHITDLKEIYKICDYITIHVPLMPSTKNMIDADAIDMMKDGVILLNYAREPLVDESAVISALKSGKIKKYLSDFPNPDVLKLQNVVTTPHLGASTEESEDNCAIMAVKELKDFLENGNIKNSVNYPNCDAGKCTTVSRITICHKNIKNMISQFSNILSAEDINIGNMLNKSKGNYAYSLFDLDAPITSEALEKIQKIDGVLKVRTIK